MSPFNEGFLQGACMAIDAIVVVVCTIVILSCLLNKQK